MSRPRLLPFVLFAASLILLPLSHAQASVSTFGERFEGGFPELWTGSPGSLPGESLFPFRPNTVAYAGGQSVTFATIDGRSVARLLVSNAPSWTRFGYLSAVILPGTIGEVEARINTLDQGGAFIDGLFDVWLVNSFDHSRYVRVGLFGDRSDSLRSWTFSSSLSPYSTAGWDNQQYLPPFTYQSDTWYRVRITQFPGNPLEVSIWNDAGDTRLVSHLFDHTLADLGSSFQIGISQWNGGTNRTNSQQCAIADIRAWLAE